MKQFIHLVANDLRHVFRDGTLILFLFIPWLVIAAVAWGVPAIARQFPVVEEYYLYIMMSASLQTATAMGFIYAFLFLEEKDEQVIQVIRILPVPTGQFILSRLLFPTLVSILGAALTIYLCQLAQPSHGLSLLIAILFGLLAPLMALTVATFARNKVEGMAFFKAINLLILLPILVFFLPVTKYLFIILPSYWAFKLYEASMSQGPAILFFTIGLFTYLVYGAGLYWQFKQRVIDR